LESPHNPKHFKTVNLENEYNGMLVQTGEQFVDHWSPKYTHHSKYWKDRVHDDSIRINNELRESLAQEAEESSPHNVKNYKTVNFGDEYNGMLLQTEYTDHWPDKRHSQYWRDRIRDKTLQTNQELMEEFTREAQAESPHNPSHYKTTNLGEEYNGMLL